MLNLVTVIGRNTHILPHMLKHYESFVDKIYVAVYRQSETDGILEEVIKKLNIYDGTFVEFGAWDGKYLSNTYYFYEKFTSFKKPESAPTSHIPKRCPSW